MQESEYFQKNFSIKSKQLSFQDSVNKMQSVDTGNDETMKLLPGNQNDNP